MNASDPMRGKFITFEGGEGSGKSTQANLLAEKLRTLGVGVKQTREPGGSPAAEVIRHILLSGAAKPLGAEAEAMLFAAARDDHLATTIRPALDKGFWVISDRFADSTRVYQGVLGEVDPRLIRRLERLIVGETWPDLTLVLDVPTEHGLLRANMRRGAEAVDRFEGEAMEFHAKLREAYRQLAASEPARCVLIDGTQTREKVAEQIWSLVNARLDPATAPMVFEDLP
jgi:dTMP kinase